MEQVAGTLKTACRDYEEDLVLYFYGEGSVAERNRVETHLAGCSRCRCFSDDLHRLLPQMTQPKELPQGFWDNYHREVMHKLAEQEERGSWWRNLFVPMRLWAVPAFGAAAVLVFGLTLTLDGIGWNPLSEPKQMAIPQEILSDPNRVEFFKSMELVESLRVLEAMDSSKLESKNAGSSHAI
ncbi:MAG: anti-sigma factor family protein [Candidatus Binatia bacterium]